MLIVTLQRDKCIGCNYCAEIAPTAFRMSRKDGKSVLLQSEEKKGFHTFKSCDHTLLPQVANAADACPVKIIHVKRI